MRRLIWMMCLLGVAAGCGPVDRDADLGVDAGQMGDAAEECLDTEAVDCTEQEAQAYAGAWNRQKRDPRERWRLFECDDGPVQHVSKPKNGRDVQECDWTTGRWDGEQWHGDEGPGEWQPVCIC